MACAEDRHQTSKLSCEEYFGKQSRKAVGVDAQEALPGGLPGRGELRAGT